MTSRVLPLPALSLLSLRLLSLSLLSLASLTQLSGCACGPISHVPDASITPDGPEPLRDGGADLPDAGPPRFPPLPACPLQPGQSYLPGAGSIEGTLTTLPAPVHSAAFGGDVAAFLHPDPWRVSEARADRTPLEHPAFEPTDTEPFRSDVAVHVAGDGTIWLTRADWRSLDDHGRSLELIGRQIIAIYCGVRSVVLDLGPSEVRPDVLTLDDGVPIATPDGATLIALPGRGVWRFFAGEGEPFLGEGESIGRRWTVGARLLIEVQRDAGLPYLVEYEGAPTSVDDALLEDVVSYPPRLEEAPMFCGRSRAGTELLAPTPTADERAAIEGTCPAYGWVEGGARWLFRASPDAGSGYYRWPVGAAPELRVPLAEALSDTRFVPFSEGGFIVYYASDTLPRYRIRYADRTRTTELGGIERSPLDSDIVVGPDHAHFVTGQTLVWLTETERIEQPIESMHLFLAGAAPDGAAWISARVEEMPPNHARLLRATPTGAPTVLLDAIESASFTWRDGLGVGQVFAYDERSDVLGFYAVEGASGLRRIADQGRAVDLLDALEGEAWFLVDGALGRADGGAIRAELEEVMDVTEAVRDGAGRGWFTSRRPAPDGYWTTRIARIEDASIEVIDEVTGSDLRLLEGGQERDFVSAPWGFVTHDGDVRVCPYTSPRACIALPPSFATNITASGRLFAWRTSPSETTLIHRSLP